MSNTNSYIVLTEQGLSAVTTQPWPQIAIKYFLPMYDERIDSLIHTESGITSVVPLSASITSADSQASLIGERIYNIPSTSGTYQLTTKNVASSAAGASFAPPETIFASTVNKGCSRTLINGKALSPVVSGNVEPIYDISSGRLQFVGGSATALPVNSWTINGSNIPRENLFDSVAFNPTQVTSGSYNVISGLFKFTLKNDIGNYRFNKIAFFIQPMKEDGTINADYDPVLFGQAVVDVSQIVEVGGKGSQSFEVTIQLAFTIKDSMVVLTNNDYWSMIPTSASTRNQNGLFFAGDVALGTSSVPNSWQPRAKMHITDDSNTPQLRLSYDTGLSGLDIKFTDGGTSGMASFTPTSGYSKGFGFVFGRNSYAVADSNANNAYAFGDWCIAEGQNAIAMGTNTSAIGVRAISIGTINKVVSYNGPSPFAIGLGNLVSAFGTSPVNFALGYCTSSIGGVAIGATSITSGYSSYAIGNNCKSLNSYTINIGDNNSLYSVYSFTLGFLNTVSGAGAYNGSIGYNNLINNDGRSKNWVFGADNISTSGVNSVTLGNGNVAAIAGGSPIILGNFNNASFGGLLVGANNEGPGSVFGNWSYSYHESLAIGTSSRAESRNSIAIGYNATITDGASWSLAIGPFANVNSISGYSTSIGHLSRSSFRGTSLGAWSKAYGIESVALGFNAQTYGTDYIQTDEDAGNNKGRVAIGSNALSWNKNYGIAIGYYAEAMSEYDGQLMAAVSIGKNVVTSAQAVGGYNYSMTTIGDSLTNKYASFMAGVSPYDFADMTAQFGAVASWNFIPLVVFGAGIQGGETRTGLAIGRLKNTDGVDQTILVMDSDRTPVIPSGSITSAGQIRYNAPKGTIFRGSYSSYGVAALYMYDPTKDVYRA